MIKSKNIKISLVVFAILCCLAFVITRYVKDTSLKTRKHGYSRYGVINEDGKEIVPPIYYDVFDFYKGYIKVKMKNRFGIIDSTGRIIAPVRYYDVGRFNANLASVRIKNKWAFINRKGKVVTEFKYDYFEYAGEGVYAVKLNNKWGFINSEGKEMTSIKYDNYGVFSEGIICVKSKDKWGYINSQGKEIIKIKYENAGDFKDGRAQVSVDYKERLIDKYGKEIIPPIYAEIQRLDNGFAYVGVNSSSVFYMWGVVNENTGKLITPLKYQQTYRARFFYDTKKIARITTSDNKVGIINENGKIIIPPIYEAIDASGDVCAVYTNKKYGYINSKGKVIVPVVNDCIKDESFFDKVCGKNLQVSSLLLLYQNGKYGFATIKGNPVTSIKYDSVEYRHLGGAFVSINKKCGYLNEKGKETIPARFDIPISKMSDYFDEGLFVYKENNKWGAIDSTGVNIIEPKYDGMTSFTWGFSIGIIGHDSYIIDTKGKSSKTLKYDKIIKCRAKIALVSINGKWGVLSKNNKLTTPIKYDEIQEFHNGFAITEIKFNK